MIRETIVKYIFRHVLCENVCTLSVTGLHSMCKRTKEKNCFKNERMKYIQAKQQLISLFEKRNKLY